MISTLCRRINQKALKIIQAGDASEHDKYKRLYRHIHDSDKTVAACFDDWRRSTIFSKLLRLQHHDLLTPEHRERLSEETQESLKMLARVL